MMITSALLLILASAADDADATKRTITDAQQARFWRLSAKSAAAQLAQRNAREAFEVAGKQIEAAAKEYAALVDELSKAGCVAQSGADGLACVPNTREPVSKK